ncbi:unnamed protein product [Lepeophtheirus salmonis]|uniref:(salmon louse) hypothetical protein n=1 Tax=Lepeophtheirus salmonis TaxID=72036 RepID=A0A7R8H616_LEPSM|nr:unnamed protein product [Lepeophtheirus salmonis]CAF2873552.1 unnamed protein product [Lepeophtheirus salmonis]
MFVGELEFSDIPFSNNALSYLIFVSFIFLIVVVLMNLLNGLAVSDTGLIREEAEVLGWLSRVELITYTESMLLGDPFYFLSNWPAIKLLKKLPHCGVCRILYKFPFMRDLLQKKSQIDDESRKAPNLYVSTDVLESAKSLILEKLRRREEEEIAKNQFQKLEMKIDRIEKNYLVRLMAFHIWRHKASVTVRGLVFEFWAPRGSGNIDNFFDTLPSEPLLLWTLRRGPSSKYSILDSSSTLVLLFVPPEIIELVIDSVSPSSTLDVTALKSVRSLSVWNSPDMELFEEESSGNDMRFFNASTSAFLPLGLIWDSSVP